MIRDLYVENSVGRALTETINRFTRNHGVTAHFQHDIHPEMQRPQKGDEWWIADIAARGMAILTQDAAILGIRQKVQQGIMTAERNPSYASLRRLATGLGLNVSELIARAEHVPRPGHEGALTPYARRDA